MTSERRAIRIGQPAPRAASMAIDPGSSSLAMARRGRGAVSNPGCRFDSASSFPFDDGWETLVSSLEAAPAVPTEIIRDASRSIISTNDSPDLGFDRSVNMYRGCEHGCVYCYARPSHAYLGYSPGLDFETKLLYKPDAARLLEREISKPAYKARLIVLGANTDPYQPIDWTLGLTRAILEVLDRFNHPVTIVTKSTGVLRDLDILGPMAARNLARVFVSITTLDGELARRMEPRAAAPRLRLRAIGELTRSGIQAAVLAAPMIPGLNDSELESIVTAAVEAGACRAGYVLLRLPLELARMFEEWLHLHYPDRARHVLKLIRQTRSGALNASTFGRRFLGEGVYAELLAGRFRMLTRRLGLGSLPDLDCSRFAVPRGVASAASRQLSLL